MAESSGPTISREFSCTNGFFIILVRLYRPHFALLNPLLNDTYKRMSRDRSQDDVTGSKCSADLSRFTKSSEDSHLRRRVFALKIAHVSSQTRSVHSDSAFIFHLSPFPRHNVNPFAPRFTFFLLSSFA